MFSAVLGRIFPFSDTILNGGTWLEIQIENDTPLLPRQQFQSVAYALKANTVPDNAITTAKIADGAITAAKLASGLAGLSLPYAGTLSSDATGFAATNNGNGTAIWGTSITGKGIIGSSVSGYGVYGENTSTSNIGYLGHPQFGVLGNSISGYGVYGSSTNAWGVYGQNTSTSNYGYLGHPNYGVFGNSTSGYGVYSNGTAGGTTEWFSTSDARYKTNIMSLGGNALDEILALRGVTYDWKRDEFKDKNFDSERHIGFIAQEVEKIFPEFVHTDRNGYKSVAYANVVPVLVEAIKAQQQKIDAQGKQLAEIAELKAQLAALTASLQEVKAAQAKVKTAAK